MKKSVLNKKETTPACRICSHGILSADGESVLASGINVVSFKFVFVLVMLWCTSPVVSHILLKTRYLTDDHLGEHCELRPETEQKEEE